MPQLPQTFLGLVLAVVVGGLLFWLKTAVESWAKASGAEAVNTRLEERKGELSQELARLTAQLHGDAERERVRFQRSLTDYAIYAQRRHDAVTDVYAALRRAHQATSPRFGAVDGASAEDFRERHRNNVYDATMAAQDAWLRNSLYLPDAIDEVAREAVESIGTYYDTLIFADDQSPTQAVGAARRAIGSAIQRFRDASRDDLKHASEL